MPHFADRKMRRPYNIYNLAALDEEIKRELGDDYETCLRHSPPSREDVTPEDGFRFDRIYVNHKGHGLLHMAATLGNLTALKHIYQKYKCDIDLSNQSVSESPLVCACRSGHFSCAIFLLDNGANGDGTNHGVEAPLHWLSRFSGEYDAYEMRVMAHRIKGAGANVERICGTMRKDVRQVNSDWEDTLSIPLSPLGRAVLMRSHEAVKVLLGALKADPMRTEAEKNVTMVSAVELACVMTMPQILETLLHDVDQRIYENPTHVYDEREMLTAAHDMVHTKSFDPLNLQSRIIRCGSQYKDWMFQTLKILYDRRNRSVKGDALEDAEQCSKIFCREVSLGNIDIVESLIKLGYDVNGTKKHSPLEAALRSNNPSMFNILIDHGAKTNVYSNFDCFRTMASRPRSSPSGTEIAESLIHNGYSVHSNAEDKSDQPSALALAVRNQYFDLATFVFSQNMCNTINSYYRWDSEETTRTVLGVLLDTHDLSSLQSIEYLVQKNRDPSCGLVLEPLVCETQRLTALHQLACFDPKKLNNRAQISSRIMQLMLEAFPSPQHLGEYHVHPIYGTPLTAAVRATNQLFVTSLLESSHRADLSKSVELKSLRSPEGSIVSMDPFDVCASRIFQCLESMEAADEATSSGWEELQDLGRILNVLLEKNKENTEQDGGVTTQPEGSPLNLNLDASADTNIPTTNSQENISDLNIHVSDKNIPSLNINDFAIIVRKRLANLRELSELQTQISRATISDASNEVLSMSAIEDLSMQTEEKPSGWVADSDMSHEASMRTMLKYLRGGMMAATSDRVMDETYNKRPEVVRPDKWNEQ